MNDPTFQEEIEKIIGAKPQVNELQQLDGTGTIDPHAKSVTHAK